MTQTTSTNANQFEKLPMTEENYNKLHTAFQATLLERDQLRARLAAIDEAPTVAYVDGNNLYLECQLQFPAFNYRHQFTNVELIARPEAK